MIKFWGLGMKKRKVVAATSLKTSTSSYYKTSISRLAMVDDTDSLYSPFPMSNATGNEYVYAEGQHRAEKR
jgi:hypothetical protein